MAELLISITRSKSDVVSAMKTKSLLWKKGIELSGIVLKDDDNDDNPMPVKFLEDMVQLRVVGVIDELLGI